MSGRLGVWFMGMLAYLPLPVLRAIGWLIGQVLYVLAAPRRRVALRNLELCFPQATLAQRKAWARETFVVFCQTWLDRSWLWSAPRDVVLQRVKLQGAVHELEGDAPPSSLRRISTAWMRGGWPCPCAPSARSRPFSRRTPIPRWMLGSWRGASALEMCACSTAPTG